MRWPRWLRRLYAIQKTKVRFLPASLMITANNYLESLLKRGVYQPTKLDVEAIQQRGMETWILTRLLSKKFRKTKADDECVMRTKQAVDHAVTQNLPLPIYFPQGGYKLWRFPTAPTVDWAEYFVISYLLNYVAPIAAVYKPGVKLVFYMHTLLMEVHDNLPTEDIKAYTDSFQTLIDLFKPHLPENVTISILKDADIYSREAYFSALEAGLHDARIIFSGFSPEKKSDFHRMSKLNIKWDGREPWHRLSREDKEGKILLSGLYEISAIQNLPKVMDQVKAPENVLVFTKATPQFIGIGSTRTSSAKYWVGFGVLEHDSKGYYERVLSPSQYDAVMHKDHQIFPINTIPMKNFTSIYVFPRLNFS
jgi:hypothetical protein